MSAHDTEREQRAEPRMAAREQQPGGDEFHHAGAVATPRLQADFGEDVDGFRCASEFEEQGLQEYDRCREAAEPTDEALRFGG